MMFMNLGSLLATKGVADLQAQNPKFGVFVERSFQRYMRYDWGDLCEEDVGMNDSALNSGGRVFAVYTHPDHPEWKIWIITESDRSATTVLFPSEY